ncbi:hypothetical protein D3C73_1216290 [compost metagenome]
MNHRKLLGKLPRLISDYCFSIEDDFSAAWFIILGHDSKQCRFSAAVGTYNSCNFAVLNPTIDCLKLKLPKLGFIREAQLFNIHRHDHSS